MRTAMSESLNWTTPEPAVSEEMNDWLTQVARAEKRKGSQAQAQERSPSLDFPEYEPPPTEICRSFRGFIGWKAIDLEDA